MSKLSNTKKADIVISQQEYAEAFAIYADLQQKVLKAWASGCDILVIEDGQPIKITEEMVQEIKERLK